VCRLSLQLLSLSNGYLLPAMQSRRLDIRLRTPKNAGGEQTAKPFVHMLNSTLTATERTLCCVLENYQTPEGLQIPPALQPFLPGITFIPFRKMFDKNGKLVDVPKGGAAAGGAAAADSSAMSTS
jgi:seryl-tRNA synthetase